MSTLLQVSVNDMWKASSYQYVLQAASQNPYLSKDVCTPFTHTVG